MAEKNSKNNSNIQSVDRALKMLQYLSTSNNAVSVKEISEAIGINRTTTYGLLNTLINNDFVVKNPSGRFTVSGKMYNLSYTYPMRHPVVRVAKKYMVELADKYECAIHLGTLSLNNKVILLKVEVPKSNFEVNSGSMFPIYASGLGKAILSFLPAQKRDDLINGIEFIKYTRQTIDNKEDLYKELEKIRERGYSEDVEEYIDGTVCCAFPIFDSTNEIIAAISVSGYKDFITEKKESIITDGLRCSKQCSSEMGWGRYNTF